MDPITEKILQCIAMEPKKQNRRETKPCTQNMIADLVPNVKWSKHAQDAYDIANHYPGMSSIMMGFNELAITHCDWRYGWSQSHMMHVMGQAMESAHMWLWQALLDGCPENAEHDDRVKSWATNLLAKFYARIEMSKPNGFFAQAMAGEVGLKGKHSFKKRFTEECRIFRHEADAFQPDHFIRRFLPIILQTSGFLLTMPSYKGPKRRPPIDSEEANYFVQGEPPMFVEDEDLVEWKKQEERERGTSMSLPRLTSDEFEWAWDRNGTKLSQLKRMMKDHEARGFGNPENLTPEIIYELRTKETLPLKWVANKNWDRMKDFYFRASLKNPPAYLTKAERALKKAAKRRLVDGLTDCDQDD